MGEPQQSTDGSEADRGIAVTVTDRRNVEEPHSGGHPEAEQRDQSGSKDSSDGLPVTRRDVLVTSVAGYLFSGTGTVAAQEEGDQTLEIELTDGKGAGYTRQPSHFRIGEDTEFTITPGEQIQGKRIDLHVEVKPVAVDGLPVTSSYERVSRTGGVLESSETFKAQDMGTRDLTTHSNISLEDFKIDADISELNANTDSRTITNTYRLRLRLLHQATEIKSQTEEFDVVYGLRNGVGVRFGYIPGRAQPTEQFRPNNP